MFLEFSQQIQIHNTAGTVEIYACGDMNPKGGSAQEARKYLAYGRFTYIEFNDGIKVK
jgi:hypothetical protein